MFDWFGHCNTYYMEILFLQAVVDQVNIEGYWRTKKDILIPGIKRVLEATTFKEVNYSNTSIMMKS